MRYQPLNIPPSYPIAAIYKNTAPSETSPFVIPQTYQVRLTVDGKEFTQYVAIKMDPRVKISENDLREQFYLSRDCYNGRKEAITISGHIASLRSQIKQALTKASGELANSLKQTDDLLAKLQGVARSPEPGFAGIENSFASLFNTLQETDMPPTSQAINAVKETWSNHTKLLSEWESFKAKNFVALNKQIQAAGMETLQLNDSNHDYRNGKKH